MQGLSPRQERVLDCIKRSIVERGYPPTLREIGDSMNIRSTNGVNDHLRALERKGFIRVEGGISRGLVLLSDSEPQDISKISKHLEDELQRLQHKMRRIREILAEP
jgi:SOS-response transcriptional repressor LexA